MNTLDVFWHDACLGHDPGTGLWELAGNWPWLDVPEQHPENPARLRTFRTALLRGPVARHLRWRQGRMAEVAELGMVHETDYLADLQQACSGPDRVAVEDNTVVGPGSWPAILAAAGTSLAAVEAVLAGDSRTAYALVRPPGHHAQPAAADGYCLVNNPALVAARARRDGLRVAVVDWDVHHGNGTQEVFYADPDVLTVSLHMRHGPWGANHPQTGAPDEIGTGPGAGYNANVELSLGAGDRAYERALTEVVEPLLRAFRPDLLVCASGFDGSTFDPNGRHNITATGYRAIGAWAARTAADLTEGRLVVTQEGGYLRGYSALCLHSLVEGLVGVEGTLLEDPLAYLPDDSALHPERTDADLAAVRAALAPYWPQLGW